MVDRLHLPIWNPGGVDLRRARLRSSSDQRLQNEKTGERANQEQQDREHYQLSTRIPRRSFGHPLTVGRTARIEKCWIMGRRLGERRANFGLLATRLGDLFCAAGASSAGLVAPVIQFVRKGPDPDSLGPASVYWQS
jgi:hypothetical protein